MRELCYCEEKESDFKSWPKGFSPMSRGGGGGGGGALPYKGLTGTCGPTGYGFQDFWFERGIYFAPFCFKRGIFT